MYFSHQTECNSHHESYTPRYTFKNVVGLRIDLLTAKWEQCNVETGITESGLGKDVHNSSPKLLPFAWVDVRRSIQGMSIW